MADPVQVPVNPLLTAAMENASKQFVMGQIEAMIHPNQWEALAQNMATAHNPAPGDLWNMVGAALHGASPVPASRPEAVYGSGETTGPWVTPAPTAAGDPSSLGSVQQSHVYGYDPIQTNETHLAHDAADPVFGETHDSHLDASEEAQRAARDQADAHEKARLAQVAAIEPPPPPPPAA